MCSDMPNYVPDATEPESNVFQNSMLDNFPARRLHDASWRFEPSDDLVPRFADDEIENARSLGKSLRTSPGCLVQLLALGNIYSESIRWFPEIQLHNCTAIV